MDSVVFFDIDGTLVRGQTQILFAKYLLKARKLNFFVVIKASIWFALYKMNLVNNVEKIMKKSYGVLKNKRVDVYDKYVKDFFEEIIRPNFFDKAIQDIENHKKEGREIILISSTIQPIVDQIKIFLNLKYGYGTRLEIKDGKYTGNIDGSVIYGLNKILIIKNTINFLKAKKEQSFAYSDHMSDAEFLNSVGHRYFVNPNRRDKKLAIKNNWNVIYY